MNENLTKTAYKWWNDNGNLSRDNFMSVVKQCQVNERASVFIRGEEYAFKKQDWMENVSNVRKLYEEIIKIYDLICASVKDGAEFSVDTAVKLKSGLEEEITSNANKEDFGNSTGLKEMKLNQRIHDSNLSLRKYFREHFRAINNAEVLYESLLEAWKEVSFSSLTVKHESIENKPVGLIQLGDLHINKYIDLENNKYNFEILSKRLKLLAIRAKQYFNPIGVKNVVVTLGGDTMTSNFRRSQDKNMITTRAKASYIGAYILSQFLIDLNSDFNLTCVSVVGNEGRVDEDWGWEYNISSENFDFIVHNLLKTILKDSKGIVFNTGDKLEEVIHVNGQNVLVIHGNGLKKHDDITIQNKIGQYASGKKILIDYVLVHHIHSTFISKLFARTGGLDGGDCYPSKGLSLDGVASQNLGIFYSNKAKDMIAVNLHHTEDISGYDYNIGLTDNNFKNSVNWSDHG